MTRPKVAFWSPLLYAAGGTETWHTTLFRHLDATRVENLGLAVAQPEEYDEDRAAALRRYAPVACGGDALARLAASCDVLVTWGIAYLSGCLPPRGARPPVVCVLHADATSPWTTSTAEAASPDVDRFVAVSRAAMSAVPLDRRGDAVVLPNGVELDRLVPRLTRYDQRRAWGLPPDRKVVGYLGRLSEEKNAGALARCVSRLPDEWVGVVVGDGPEGDSVRADGFACAPGRVAFPGRTEDVGSALAAMDALLVPSREEGFGLQMGEAMGAGVPVVSTPVGLAADCPPLVRTIRWNATADEMAAAVLADARDPLATAARVRLAAATVRRLYSAEAFAERWMAFIETVA